MSKIKGQHRFIIFLIFCFSGFSALVYEVLWTKYLSLTFGTTMAAVSIVAATFMAGLAIGSYLLGKYADQDSNLLRIYAFLEIGIALFALSFPPALKVVNHIHIYFERLFGHLPLLDHFLHLSLSSALLIPPTVFMGGTFPLMCRYFARNKSGAQIGRLYAINTIGAASGAFLSGYLLIPSLGLSKTNTLAAAINLVIAAVAWQMSRSREKLTTVEPVSLARKGKSRMAKGQRSVLLASALIGFLALAYEILWTRVFMLFLGNTSYAFALILSSFLICIALGGALYSRIITPETNEKKLFVRLTVLMGLSIMVTVPFYDQLAHVMLWAHEATNDQWWLLSLLSGTVVFAVISVPVIISGCLFPAAIAILDPGRQRTGEGVGLVVLYNTVGAVLGSLTAGFALVALIGLQNSFQLLGALNALLGAMLCMTFIEAAPRRRAQVGAVCVVAVTLAFLNPKWDQGLMNSGVYIYASKYIEAGGIKQVLAEEKIIKVIEGMEATVAIHESNDGQVRFFSVNGKTDGGTGRDMATQVLVGHLPMLLHEAPNDVLVVGLGTGITLNGMSCHPTNDISCVEISSEVVEASSYFNDSNDNALDDSKTTLLVNDGRNLLLTEDKLYDVIVSEPSNPWQSGNANLFTDEFYQLAASRLKVGGLFTQWIGIYDITPENLRIAVNTLLKNFPEALAFINNSDLIIVGAQHELKFDYMRLRKRMNKPGIREIMARIGVDSPGSLVTKHYLYSDQRLRSFSLGAQINTDDMPILEYSARDLLGDITLGNLQMKNIQALTASNQQTVLPITNLGQDVPSIINSLRELSNDFSDAGRTAEAEKLRLKAEELESKQTHSKISVFTNSSPPRG